MFYEFHSAFLREALPLPRQLFTTCHFSPFRCFSPPLFHNGTMTGGARSLRYFRHHAAGRLLMPAAAADADELMPPA